MNQRPRSLEEQRLDALDDFGKKALRGLRSQLGPAINASLDLARGTIMRENNQRIDELLDNYETARRSALNKAAPPNSVPQDLVFDLMEVISMMTQNFAEWRNGIQGNIPPSSESPTYINPNINIKPEPLEEVPEVPVITIDEGSSSSSSSSPNQAGSSQVPVASYFVTPPTMKPVFQSPSTPTQSPQKHQEHVYDPNKEIKRQPRSAFDVAVMEDSGASPTRPAKRRAQNVFYGEADDEEDEDGRQQMRPSVLMTTPRTQPSVIVTAAASAPAPPGQYVCDRCDRTFAKEAGLKRHVLVHNGVRCTKCSVFMAKDKLAAHMRKLHRGFKAASEAPGTLSDDEGDVDVDGLAGDEEDHVFAVPALPSRLIRAASEAIHGENKFPCNQCGLTFKSPGGVNKHMVVHKRGYDDRERFKCPHCPITRTVMSMIKCHIRSEHGIDPYDCDICGETFARKSFLVEHRARRHGVRASMARESVARSEI